MSSPAVHSRHLLLRHALLGAAVVLLSAGVLAVIALGDTPARAAASPGVTTRVSVADNGSQANGTSSLAAISGTGRWVAFTTTAQLDPLDQSREGSDEDVYVRDTQTGHTTLLSRGHEFVPTSPSPSPSPSPSDTGGGGIILRRALLPTPAPADDRSFDSAMSSNGRFVAFYTFAENIVDTDSTTEPLAYVVVCDRDPNDTGTFDNAFAYTLIGEAEAFDPSIDTLTMSADATRLAFTTTDDRFREHVVLATLQHGTRHEITGSTSVTVPVPATVPASGGRTFTDPESANPALSADGTHLALISLYFANNQGDPVTALWDYDVATQQVTRLDLDDAGHPISVGTPTTFVDQVAESGDGHQVAFTVTVGGAVGTVLRVLDRDPDGDGVLGPGAAPDQAIRSQVVSLDRAGKESSGRSPAFSADGRYLAYATDAANVHNGLDDPVQQSSCVHPQEDLSARPAASGPPTGLSTCDIVVRDLVVDRARVAAGLPRLPAELASPSLRSDCAAFVAGGTCEGDGDSDFPVLDADGSAVAYTSRADDLVTDDTNRFSDVFLRRFTPGLTADPLDFGQVRLDQDLTLAVPVAHNGFGPLTVQTVKVGGTNADDFTAEAPDTCPDALLHETDRCLVTVRFKPGALGDRTATLLVTWRGGPAPLSVPLRGTGVKVPVAGFDVTPDPVDFGTRPVTQDSPQATVTVTNPGDGPLTVTGVAVVGGGPTTFPDDYRITGNTCAAGPVPPGGTCRVTLVQRPLGIGARPAALSFDLAGIGTRLVPLNGAGTQPTLKANPPLAPAGRVSQVTGTAFPPGQRVTLTLDGMPTTTTVVAGPDGGFVTPLLVLPHTYAGPRQLHATVTVSAGLPTPVTVALSVPFLVVPGTLQPPDFATRN